MIPERIRRQRRLATNLLLAVFGTALALGVLEGGARLIGLKKGLFFVMTERRCMQRSAALGFEMHPNCVVTSRPRGITFGANSIGLRSPELRSDGSIRILALGDSSTWGWGVNQEDTYPSLLQQILDEEYGADRYQVINGGRPGWTSYQGRVWLGQPGLAPPPAITILSFGFNDAVKFGDDETRITRQAPWYPILLADDFFLDRSVFYSWFRWQLQGGIDEAEREPRVTADKHHRNMRAMVMLVRGEGGKAVFLSFPHMKNDDRTHRQVLGNLAREMSVPLLTYEGPRFDSVHPTAAGYRKLVPELVTLLQEREYVP